MESVERAGIAAAILTGHEQAIKQRKVAGTFSQKCQPPFDGGGAASRRDQTPFLTLPHKGAWHFSGKVPATFLTRSAQRQAWRTTELSVASVAS